MVKKFISNIYGFFVGRRNAKFDNSSDIVRCRVPVISVGNLSVGGTGKTPFVQMLTKYFLSKGFRPGIVGKGYKRSSKGEVIVGNGSKVLVSADVGGDEMVLLADTLKVPVIAHNSKTEAALSMQDKFDVDLIIIDDGFQHRRLHRDLDIVLIDRESFDNPEILPVGRLREPIESIKRADVVCSTGDFELLNNFTQHFKEKVVNIRVKPVETNPYYLSDKSQIKIRDTKQNPVNCVAIAGIAKPYRFFGQLEGLGYNVLASHSFSDHHNYSKKDLKLIIKLCKEKNCRHIAITEKDATKLNDFTDIFKNNGISCVVFPIALTITDGKIEFFKLLGNKINRRIQNNRRS